MPGYESISDWTPNARLDSTPDASPESIATPFVRLVSLDRCRMQNGGAIAPEESYFGKAPVLGGRGMLTRLQIKYRYAAVCSKVCHRRGVVQNGEGEGAGGEGKEGQGREDNGLAARHQTWRPNERPAASQVDWRTAVLTRLRINLTTPPAVQQDASWTWRVAKGRGRGRGGEAKGEGGDEKRPCRSTTNLVPNERPAASQVDSRPGVLTSLTTRPLAKRCVLDAAGCTNEEGRGGGGEGERKGERRGHRLATRRQI